MTAEVALLNRRAIALAADSATTVSYWERGERKERYFKGTNKLFHLSTVHPIGLMTFDSGNFQGVPWEVLVKAYRDAAAGKPHDYAAGYATDLFEYIETNTHIFPVEVQDKQLISDVADTATRFVAMIVVRKTVKDETDPKAKRKKADAAFKALSDSVKKAKLIDSATPEMVAEIVSKFLDSIKKEILERKFVAENSDLIDVDKLAKLAAHAVLTANWTTLDTTGIVVCGFGEKEYFPYLRVYTVYGIVLGKLLFEPGKESVISQENVSEIVPFAQSNMVRTFIYGVNSGGFERHRYAFC